MKTIRVKIAVAVDGRGKWNACGYHDYSDASMIDVAVEGLESTHDFQSIVWVTAAIPVPEAVTVEGSAGELGPIGEEEG